MDSESDNETGHTRYGIVVVVVYYYYYYYYYLWIPQIGSLIPNRGGLQKKRVADTKYKKDEKRKKETNKIKKGERIRMIDQIV